MSSVRLLYDERCPFCSLEVRFLQRWNKRGRLSVEDISDPAFDATRYGLTDHEVHAILHAVNDDGTVVRRMDAVRAAYDAVGLGWVMAPTTWPLLRRLSDAAYELFARHRVRVGRVFGGTCPDDTCSLPSKTPDASP